MNEFLEEWWLEKVDRLALGLEPIDAALGTRFAHPLRVIVDGDARGLRRPQIQRHASCLHALLYQPGIKDRVKLRLIDGQRRMMRRRFDDSRRFVPRLISFPILAADTVDGIDYRHRVRRPFLFPGAGFDIASGTTGLRGQVKMAGQSVRWTRVEAKLPGTTVVVGRAHGDDRGEFLLCLNSNMGDVGGLGEMSTIDVQISAPTVVPGPAPAQPDGRDPYWDLPEEKAQPFPPGGFDDDVSAGEQLPDGYSLLTGRLVDLALGRVGSAVFTAP